MATINVTEKDFEAAANAAWRAKRAGDEEGAGTLDKLARKINAALSAGSVRVRGFTRVRLSWTDMPSVFDTTGSP